MNSTNKVMVSFDGTELKTFQWLVEGAKAQLVIVHGMAEHGMRYERLAKHLNQSSISAITYDQRAHGQTAKSIEKLGCPDGQDFWNDVLQDLALIVGELDDGIPTFLMGHSMGSFIARAFALKSKDTLQGLILSGTQGNPGPLLSIGKLVANLIGKIKGKDHLSRTLNTMSFGKFNDAFKPAQTDFDWLSRDEAEVQKYIDSPYCGHLVSVKLWKGLLHGVGMVNESAAFKITSTMPVYLFAGDRDPVGSFGKGVTEVYNNYKKAGVKDLTIKLYKDARHEMLNETNREEVFQGISNWIIGHI